VTGKQGHMHLKSSRTVVTSEVTSDLTNTVSLSHPFPRPPPTQQPPHYPAISLADYFDRLMAQANETVVQQRPTESR
jgi:hypothetical protein